MHTKTEEDNAMTRTFFSKKRAEAFAAELKRNKNRAEIWMDTDAFGQKIYIVKW